MVKDLPQSVHWRERGTAGHRKQNVPPFRGGTWQAFYAGGGPCQHGEIYLFEHDLLGKPVPTFPDHARTRFPALQDKAIRIIPVPWKTLIAMPRCRNMWTHGR
jgi:hypothetical protein